MAQLIVRRLDEVLVRKLRARAVRHGHSAEAEHREILRQALGDEGNRRSLKDELMAIPTGGSDGDFARARRRTRAVRL
jgi:plasmid stability protein